MTDTGSTIPHTSSPFLQARQNVLQPPVTAPMVPITEAELRDSLPEQFRDAVTPQLVNLITNISTDDLIAARFKENLISYGVVLKEGKFSVEDYINAVAYVSYKAMGYTNEESYAKALPHRYNKLIAQGKAKKDIAAYIYAYNKGKLVNLILEQTLVPTWVLNADVYQKAINVQLDLMVNANSELVRQKAADSIMNHLKKPDSVKVDINVSREDNSGMKEMRNMLFDIAKRQKEIIDEGKMKTIDVAAQRITDLEPE